MRRFAIKLTSKGQVTLPAEYRRLVGARAGDRLSLIVDDEGRGTLTKAVDDLSVVHDIVRRARAEAAPPSAASDDPIGDYLIEADERTKSRR